MTAGQRNCHIALEECLQRYGWDDLLVALIEHVRSERDKSAPDSTFRVIGAHNTMADLEDIRERLCNR